MTHSHSPSTTEMLLGMLDEAFERKAWHGPNLRGSIRGLPARQAGWRPAPGRRSIADIVVHAAYWKYAVRRRLRGDARGSFPLKGSNWFKLPEPLSEADWRGFVRLLIEQHGQLRRAVSEVGAGQWNDSPPGRKTTNLTLVLGITLHDIYHAGQIQTLKALYKSRAAK
jgi:uncharacterized damage-inducible protein DinB